MINTSWKSSFKQTQVVEITKVDQGSTMGSMLAELIGYSSHEILGLAKCDPRSKADRWDKWLMLVSSEGKNWEEDPRPPNWAALGWAVTVKRPGSPLKESLDTKKYTSIRWDSHGRTVSKTTVTPSTTTTPIQPSSSSSLVPTSLNPRAQVTVNNEGFKMVGGKPRKNLPKKPKIVPVKVVLKRGDTNSLLNNNPFST